MQLRFERQAGDPRGSAQHHPQQNVGEAGQRDSSRTASTEEGHVFRSVCGVGGLIVQQQSVDQSLVQAVVLDDIVVQAVVCDYSDAAPLAPHKPPENVELLLDDIVIDFLQ